MCNQVLLMRNIFFIPLFVLISCFTLEAADFYLMFDPNCMNRMTYRTQAGSELTKYSLQLNDNEQVMLEVGSEDQASVQSFLPRQAFRCGNSFISQNLTSILQNSSNNVFLVKPAANNAYKIIPVVSYDYYLQEGNYMVYNGQQFRFSFSPSLAAVGQDLSSNDPRGRVTFEGRIKYNCADALLFKQNSGLSANSATDIVFVPQLGVVEQKSPQFNNTLQLVQVNDMTTATFLQQFCNENNMNSTAGLNNYGSGAFNNNNNTDVLSNRGQQQPAAAKIHVVEKGETLYGIARNYNINIDELRSWNNMDPESSFIRTGTKLKVSPGSDEFSSRSVSSYSDMSFNTRPVFKNNNSINPPWKTTTGIHVVKPGETLSSIAQLYGYTPERFRDFNKLAPNTQVKEGQVLKTSDCEPDGNNIPSGAMNNYNNNSFNNTNTQGIQPSQPNYSISNPQVVDEGNTNYDAYYFNRGSNPDNYNYSQPIDPATGTTRNNQNKGSDLFEPYSIFNNQQNTNNTNTSKGGGNVNISPSQYNQYSNPNSAFGTPVPNTSAPKTNNSTNAREPFQDLNSPVPGVNTNTPRNQNNLNVAPQQNNSNQNFRMGGTTNYYNNPPANAKRISHIVKQGETMESIARKYNIPLNKLLQLNRMQKGESVLPDQRVYLN